MLSKPFEMQCLAKSTVNHDKMCIHLLCYSSYCTVHSNSTKPISGIKSLHLILCADLTCTRCKYSIQFAHFTFYQNKVSAPKNRFVIFIVPFSSLIVHVNYSSSRDILTMVMNERHSTKTKTHII